MARTPASPGSAGRRPITAAANRIPVRTATSGLSKGSTSDGGWQAESWAFFDEVPEVKFAARFMGSALSRLRFYPAIVVEPDSPPMSLADAVEVEESGVTADLAAAADAEMSRLDASGDGMAGIQREAGVCLTISGECYLIGRDVDGEEQWRIVSESAVVRTGDILAVKETPGGNPVPLVDNDFVARIWRRHSRWPGLADSNMRSVLDVCVAEGTIVATATGPRRIEEVEVGDKVWSWEPGGMVLAAVARVLPRGVRSVVKIRTANRTIRATPEHEMLVLRRVTDGKVGGRRAIHHTEWVPAGQIRRGDLLVVADGEDDTGTPQSLADGTSLSEDVAWLLGALVGDGSAGGIDTISLATAANDEYRAEADRIMADTWGLRSGPLNGTNTRWHSRRLNGTLRDLGVIGTPSTQRRVPRVVLAAPAKIRRAFLDGYTDADGHRTARGYIAYAATSGRLVAEIRAIYQALGDPVSNIHVEERKPLHVAGNDRLTENPLPLHRFDAYIRKGRPGESAITSRDGWDTIGEGAGVARVLEVTDDGESPVWDLDVPGPACFLADGAVAHNCEELLIYGRQFRAVGRSRNNAGVLLLPNELDFAAQRVVVDDPDGTGPLVEESDEDDMTDMERSIVESLVTPTADDGSASQVVPHLLRGPLAALAGVRHIALDRKIDEQAIPRMVYLNSRLANGLDVPPEVLTGMADSNHWTSWQIEDATYKAHVEPLAQIPAQGIALVFLRPALLDAGFDPAIVNRVLVALDPSDLVVRPNRGADAKDAFDRDALSWDALRGYLGFSDADAPSEEELVLRYTLDRSIGGMSLTRDLLNETGLSDVPTGAEQAALDAPGAAPADMPSPQTPPEEGGPPVPAGSAALLASGAPSPVGERLAAIDARLRERLQVAASGALTAALSRAGSRLRTRAQGIPDLSDAVRDVPNEQVGEAMRGTGIELAGTDSLISDADFAALGVTFASWVANARREATEVVRRAALAQGITTDAFDTLQGDELASTGDDDQAGWLLLLGALVLLGRSRVFSPAGTPDDGEFDAHMAVPPGPVREALARAGGLVADSGAPSVVSEGIASGGPASGRTMLRLVMGTGALEVGWRWDVGFPAVPFHPHQALAGVEFRAWDAEVLTNASGFPHGGFYYPGDHKGCACDAVPILVYPAVPAANALVPVG